MEAHIRTPRAFHQKVTVMLTFFTDCVLPSINLAENKNKFANLEIIINVGQRQCTQNVYNS